MCNNNQRILITGAGGFIGSRLVRRFIDAGYHVAAVGRFDSDKGLGENLIGAEVTAGMTLPDARFHDLITRFKPQSIIHCAAPAAVPFSVTHPYDDYCGAADVCAFVLETLRLHAPDCRFYLISSAAVYGNPSTLPVNENALCAPISPYGYHKLICELLAQEYAEFHGVRGAVLRIFSAFGRGLRRQVIHDLFQKFLVDDGAPVKIIGMGKESRDFIYLDDITNALLIAVEKSLTGTFNLATGIETSISELAEKIRQIVNNKKEIVTDNQQRRGDPERWCADIGKLKQYGFAPQISLDDGLRDYYRWLITAK